MSEERVTEPQVADDATNPIDEKEEKTVVINDRNAASFPQGGAPNMTDPDIDSRKLVAGVLALFFGYLGVHKFYLGLTKVGITYLILLVLGLVAGVLFSCRTPMIAWVGFAVMGLPLVLGWVDAYLYFTCESKKFYNNYIAGHKDWF